MILSTLKGAIDTAVEWLNANVCSKISLKLPDDYKNDADYDVVMVNPTAFPLYIPGKDRLPPNIAAPIPSICVQLMEGDDDLIGRKRKIQIRLCLACWNPGTHSNELFLPKDNPDALGGVSYYRVDGEAAQAYTRNMDGWKDSINFADLTLRELENAEYLDGIRIVKEDGIKFGQFIEDGDDENVWDFYPYWHFWIRLTLETGITQQTPAAYENYL